MVIEQEVYDGSLIHRRFAYRFFKKQVNPSGNIVSFVAPMDVTDNLIDLEDKLNNDYIYSDWAFNFCWEIPGIDRFGSVVFQRLFNINIANILQKYVEAEGFNINGDDIMIDGKKASVSIACVKDGAALGHTGINIIAGDKAPEFAYSTKIKKTTEFVTEVEKCFYEMLQDIFVATTKIVV
jgi:hypothetical protein